MENMRRLPIGIESFREIREADYYYIDKTRLIEQLLTAGGKVSLFTRPRRFGKTLNMSMLRCFFEIGAEPALFDGLYISANKALCEAYLGRFPVIFLSLKSIEGNSFEEACGALRTLLREEVRRFRFLAESSHIPEDEKLSFRRFLVEEETQEDVQNGLKMLSSLLHQHYGKKSIILIDEYDVPLDKAFQNGFYREMVSLIRAVFGKALKTNDDLQLAVLTGCLRISKESIFTGLNNFTVFSITDPRFDEQFGFTEDEVKKLLCCYELEAHLQEVRSWYDGYRFGNADVYCPWDVINYAALLREDPQAEPQSYWINTSGNGLVRRFIDKADRTTQREIEALIAGESIEKNVHLELTYDEIDSNIENLWSVLFTTGYLTQAERSREGVCRLKIPNEEVRDIFKEQIREWFKKLVAKDTEGLEAFWAAFSDGDAEAAETYLTKMLQKTISIFDPKGGQKEKERFYHAFLAGILIGNSHWAVLSNREAGDGLADLLVEAEDSDTGIVVELKSVGSMAELDAACRQAIEQIRDRRYAAYFYDEGRQNVRLYGIAFCKKCCRVVSEKAENGRE